MSRTVPRRMAAVPAGAETADEFVARINREFADFWLEEQNEGRPCGW